MALTNQFKFLSYVASRSHAWCLSRPSLSRSVPLVDLFHLVRLVHPVHLAHFVRHDQLDQAGHRSHQPQDFHGALKVLECLGVLVGPALLLVHAVLVHLEILPDLELLVDLEDPKDLKDLRHLADHHVQVGLEDLHDLVVDLVSYRHSRQARGL